MATFNPYNKAIKESINVDFKDRVSPQKVILCNRENKFYGEFIGHLNSDSIDIKGGKLTNVTLSNVIICDAAGHEYNLSSLQKVLGDIEAEFSEFSDGVVPYISAEISGNAEDIFKLSSMLTNSGANIDVLSSQITAEALIRKRQDEGISSNVRLSVDSLVATDGHIMSSLTQQAQNVSKKLDELSADLIGQFIDLKHYARVEKIGGETLTENSFQLVDWASNHIDTQVPFTYVRISKDSGDTTVNNEIIGKIVDVEFDGQNVDEFNLVVFDDLPSGVPSHFRSGVYHFTRDQRTVDLGDGYTITWNWNGQSSRSTAQFYFTLSGEESEVLGLSCENKEPPFGSISNFQIEGGDLISGVANIRFSGFDGDQLEFGPGMPNSRYFPADAESGKKNRRITFDSDNGGMIVLEDDINLRMCKNLVNSADESTWDNTLFGRIYEGNAEYSDSDQLTGLTVSLYSPTESECPMVRDGNGFTYKLPDGYQIVVPDDGATLSVIKPHKKYGFDLREFDEAVQYNPVIGSISVENENVSDIFSGNVPVFVTVTFGGGILAGSYTLTSIISDGEIIKFHGDFTVPSGGHLELNIESADYTQATKVLKYVHTLPNKTVDGHMYFDNERVVWDETELFASCQIANAGERIAFTDEDAGDVSITTCEWYRSGETEPVSFTIYPDDSVPNIKLKVPDDLGNGRNREFILVLDFHLPAGNGKTRLEFVDCTDRFWLNQKDITNDFVVGGEKAIFKFTEFKRGEFCVEDLTNADIIAYINERLRGGVNYGGKVLVVDGTGETYQTAHLSNLFYLPPDGIPAGWNYPKPEYADFTTLISHGNMFYVGRTELTQTGSWTIDGTNLQLGDYVIVNKDVRICDVTSADLDVIDAMDRDTIVVDKITVNDIAEINSIVATSATINDITNQTAKIRNLEVTVADISNGNALNLSAGSITADAENILRSEISSLNVSSEYALSVVTENLSVDQFSINLSAMRFFNGDDISSMSDISSSFDKRIKDLGDIGGDCEELKTRYNKSLSSYQPEPQDDKEWPDQLVLRDQVKTNFLYKLCVRNGMLALDIWEGEVDGVVWHQGVAQ